MGDDNEVAKVKSYKNHREKKSYRRQVITLNYNKEER